MTLKQAQERNNKIMQFRGLALRINGLIPIDIYDRLNYMDKILIIEAKKVYEKIINIMNQNIDCSHIYEENICYLCNHKKYSRDGLGKAKEKTFKPKCNGTKILGTRQKFIIVDDIEQGLDYE